MIKVLDDLISKEFQKEIFNELKDISWNFLETVTFEDSEEDLNSGFYKMVYSISEDKPIIEEKLYYALYPHIKNIIDEFDINDEFEELYRIKIGMFVKNQSRYLDALHHSPHVDSFEPHYTILYYVMDSDGPTYIFNKKKKVVARIEPKMGRSVLMSGDVYHASSCPRLNNRRIVLNINFGKKYV